MSHRGKRSSVSYKRRLSAFHERRLNTKLVLETAVFDHSLRETVCTVNLNAPVNGFNARQILSSVEKGEVLCSPYGYGTMQ